MVLPQPLNLSPLHLNINFQDNFVKTTLIVSDTIRHLLFSKKVHELNKLNELNKFFSPIGQIRFLKVVRRESRENREFVFLNN